MIKIWKVEDNEVVTTQLYDEESLFVVNDFDKSEFHTRVYELAHDVQFRQHVFSSVHSKLILRDYLQNKELYKREMKKYNYFCESLKFEPSYNDLGMTLALIKKRIMEED